MAHTSEEQAKNISEMTQKFKEIMKANGINDPISEVIIKDSGLQGENMASVTSYVSIKFEDLGKSPLDLFVKTMSASESHNAMKDGKLFEKEAMFFMKYVPDARSYCKSKGVEELMSIYPKCYFGDNQLMVFENLVLGKGYVLLDKVERQDLDAAKLSLVNLAKHHAISVALIKENGGADKFYEKYPDLESKSMLTGGLRNWIEPGMTKGMEVCMDVLKTSGLDQDQKVTEKLRGFHAAGPDAVFDLMENDNGNFKVLNHGDYWNNNMMFLKDTKTGKVINHVAIDLQAVYHGSPSLDLGYFVYTSVKGNVRRDNLVELLRLYLDTLKVAANELGHPVDLTIEELYESYCKNFKFGFYFTFMMSEAGLAAGKEIDINELGDISDVMEMYDRMIQKWLANNPDRAKNAARNIIESMEEYEQLENRTLRQQL